MALIELITEQHGIDEEGNFWVLSHRDPAEWTKTEEWNGEVLDTPDESDS